MSEPRLHISPEKHPAAHRIGNIRHKRDRTKALDILDSGGTIQMIIGDKKNGVGGIFFNLDHPEAIAHVVKIKSTPKKIRPALFSVMTPDEYFTEVADLNFPDYQKILSLACFLRIPVKNLNLFPPHAISTNEAGLAHIQAFPSDRVPFFSRLVREAMSRGIRIGGTSLNYTGEGNLSSTTEVSQFFQNSGRNNFWLNSNTKLTGVSYTIIEFLDPKSPQYKLVREGNLKPSHISKKLHYD